MQQRQNFEHNILYVCIETLLIITFYIQHYSLRNSASSNRFQQSTFLVSKLWELGVYR